MKNLHDCKKELKSIEHAFGLNKKNGQLTLKKKKTLWERCDKVHIKLGSLTLPLREKSIDPKEEIPYDRQKNRALELMEKIMLHKNGKVIESPPCLPKEELTFLHKCIKLKKYKAKNKSY